MPNIDIARGRKRRTDMKTGVIGTSPVSLLSADPSRVALNIGSDNQSLLIQPITATSASNGGLYVGKGQNGLLIDVETYGDLVTGAIQICGLANGARYQMLIVYDTEYRGELAAAGQSGSLPTTP